MRRPNYSNYSNNVGLKITELRKSRSFTQEEFGIRLGEYMRRNKPFSVAAISAWEIGRKKPTSDVMVGIAGFFGITVEELLGADIGPDDFTTDDRPNYDTGTEIQQMADREIKESDLKQYHKRPVFLVFPNKDMSDQWAIVDFKNSDFHCVSGIFKFWEYPVKIYPLEAYPIAEASRKKSHPVSIDRMMKLTRLWIEMNTADDEIRNKWNGWYVHNKDHTSLINISNGNVLPDRGYGVSFRAYSEPYDVVEHDMNV